MKVSYLVLAIVLASGCGMKASELKPYTRLASFDPGEYTQYKARGSCSVSGQAFLKTAGGAVKYGAGNTVALLPATTYSKEWYDHAVIQSIVMTIKGVGREL